MKPADRWKAVIELRGLTAIEKAVLGCFAFHADIATLEAWPALDTVADETGVSRSAAWRAIQSLIADGHLSVVIQTRGRHSNRYRVNLDKPAATRKVDPAPTRKVNGRGNLPSGTREPAPRRISTCSLEAPNRYRTGIEQRDPPSAPSFWDLWTAVAGGEKRSLLGKLIAEFGEEEVAVAVAITSAKRPADPSGFIRGVLRKRKPSQGDHEWISPV